LSLSSLITLCQIATVATVEMLQRFGVPIGDNILIRLFITATAINF